MCRPWYKSPDGYKARRLEMDNGDIALFCWTEQTAYWIGNTETPSALWRTDKYTFKEVPDHVADWAERELLAQLYEAAPWLEAYPHISEFFLPVLLSKDGRHTSRTFFREHAAGFPDADSSEALSFYEDFLATGALDNRYVMAAKLGTSEQLNLGRMSSTMSEFTVAKLLVSAGYEVVPEIEVTTGHFIDFRAKRDDHGTLVEVTRPLPPDQRTASSAITSIKETVSVKAGSQLQEHGGGVTLFVDCSSFLADDWEQIVTTKPDVCHRPAVVFRAHPDGSFEGYTNGSVPIDLPDSFEYQ